MRIPVLLLLITFLAGCASGPRIDSRHQSLSHDSRVRYVVLHYTSSGFERSLNSLTRGPVSSHYLIDEKPATIYRLVDEERRAWHAGESSWQGRTHVNGISIGIELVHRGYLDTPEGWRWYPWEQEQIDSLISLLQDILQRHDLTPAQVIGHSDVAPQRKVDPGPLFPWQQLAEAGVAIWPDADAVAQYQAQLAGLTPSVAWFQQALAGFGYEVPRSGLLDQATRNVLAAFQMRFRPSRHDGQPDAQSAAILAALVPTAARSALWCASDATDVRGISSPPCLLPLPGPLHNGVEHNDFPPSHTQDVID